MANSGRILKTYVDDVSHDFLTLFVPGWDSSGEARDGAGAVLRLCQEEEGEEPEERDPGPQETDEAGEKDIWLVTNRWDADVKFFILLAKAV